MPNARASPERQAVVAPSSAESLSCADCAVSSAAWRAASDASRESACAARPSARARMAMSTVVAVSRSVAGVTEDVATSRMIDAAENSASEAVRRASPKKSRRSVLTTPDRANGVPLPAHERTDPRSRSSPIESVSSRQGGTVRQILTEGIFTKEGESLELRAVKTPCTLCLCALGMPTAMALPYRDHGDTEITEDDTV